MYGGRPPQRTGPNSRSLDHPDPSPAPPRRRDRSKVTPIDPADASGDDPRPWGSTREDRIALTALAVDSTSVIDHPIERTPGAA